MPHLAAIAILTHQQAQSPARARRRSTLVSTPAQTAALIDELRTAGTTLTYDPAQQTLRVSDSIAVTISH
jgi:alkanesulfonate monooxygenase SsuD/methylene tetrahydromethanopterin reductase-like flavin-dependent oxidoreductase (luciferase family)